MLPRRQVQPRIALRGFRGCLRAALPVGWLRRTTFAASPSSASNAPTHLASMWSALFQRALPEEICVRLCARGSLAVCCFASRLDASRAVVHITCLARTRYIAPIRRMHPFHLCTPARYDAVHRSSLLDASNDDGRLLSQRNSVQFPIWCSKSRPRPST